MRAGSLTSMGPRWSPGCADEQRFMLVEGFEANIPVDPYSAEAKQAAINNGWAPSKVTTYTVPVWAFAEKCTNCAPNGLVFGGEEACPPEYPFLAKAGPHAGMVCFKTTAARLRGERSTNAPTTAAGIGGWCLLPAHKDSAAVAKLKKEMEITSGGVAVAVGE